MGVLVAGSTHMDFYITESRFPSPGEAVRGEASSVRPGGKGAN